MANICVVPKKDLGFGYSPLKLYEYMSCGKPVIATDTAGFEILEKYNAGVLVNTQDPQEFADAIIKLLKDKQLMKEMGMNGRNLVVNNYTWEIASKKTSEVFQKLLREE